VYSIILDKGVVIRDSDQKPIAPCESPLDPDYLAYTQWVQEGHSPVEIPSEATLDEIATSYIEAIQAHLDRAAQTRGYDNMLSLTSYALSEVPRFKSEAAAGIAWRDQVWAFGFTYLEEAKQGLKPILPVLDLLALLPSMEWPV